MLIVIAWVYITLCLRIRVQLEAAFADGQGGAAIRLGAYGLYVKREYVFVKGEKALSVRIAARHGRKRKLNKAHPASAGFARFLRNYVINILRSGCFDSLKIHLQLGLGDACETAVAAGAAHALACALLAYTNNRNNYDPHIAPQFSGVCLRLHLQGLFFCQAGDILFAALKAAFRKKKAGLK